VPKWLADAVGRAAKVAGEALDRHGSILFGLLAAAYLAAALALASQKLVWYDEVFTYYFAHFPSLGQVWSELKMGDDPTPPFFYVLTRTFVAIFGSSEVSIRLPEALAFVLMGAALYTLVAKRSRPRYGLVAVLFVLASGVYGYAYEARPYGLPLGFAAVALLCWQLAADADRYRRPALVGLGAGLAAAVACHYYAVLILIPLGLGELVRSLYWKRLDIWVWLAFSAALLPLAVGVPLIQAATKVTATFWARPGWLDVPSFYVEVLRGKLAAFGGCVIALAGLEVFRQSRGPRCPESLKESLPLHELVALLGFVLLPLFGVVLGKLVTGAYTVRYAVPAVLGIGALVAFAAYRLDQRYAFVGVLLVGLLAVSFVRQVAHAFPGVIHDAKDQRDVLRFLAAANRPGLPIVIASTQDYTELTYAGAKRGRGRFIYLVDRQSALRSFGTDTVELNMLELRRISPSDVRDYHGFLASHRNFLVYQGKGWGNWLVGQLRADGRHLSVIKRRNRDVIFKVAPASDDAH
jgi:hypothetical protein